jgi:hypothetical protein
MSRIQIADLNSSEYSYISDINNGEISTVIGGFWSVAIRLAVLGVKIAIKIVKK